MEGTKDRLNQLAEVIGRVLPEAQDAVAEPLSVLRVTLCVMTVNLKLAVGDRDSCEVGADKSVNICHAKEVSELFGGVGGCRSEKLVSVLSEEMILVTSLNGLSSRHSCLRRWDQIPFRSCQPSRGVKKRAPVPLAEMNAQSPGGGEGHGLVGLWVQGELSQR